MKRVAFSAVLSLVVSSTFVPLPIAANQPQSFTTLAKRFINESEVRDPLFADSLGIHAYDSQLDDYSKRGADAREVWLRHWRGRIDASMHESTLTPDQDADAHALLDTIDLELFEDARVKPRETDPTFYTGVIGQAVYSLTGRHYAPADERFADVASRLPLIPGIVAAAEANLTHPPRITTVQAIDENEGNIELYTSLLTDDTDATQATKKAVAAAMPAVLASLNGFSTYLHTQLLPRSNGNPRVGAKVFDRELLLSNGTSETREQLVAEAQSDFDANRKTMLDLAIPFDQKFFPNFVADEQKPNAEDIVVHRVLDRLALDHPTRKTVFKTASTDVYASEAFLKANPVVVLPRPATLKVKPTPDFMAGFSGASLDPAGPFSPLGGSYYYIDKIPKTWSPGRVTSYLRDFNNYEMKILSIHEAVPGHYVQLRYNARVPSIVRRTLPNGSFVEGWAVYGEGMMLDAGYGDNDPRLRLFQLKWRLREEANTIIDAEFHTGNLNEARCDDFLEREAYQEKAEADTKWHRLQLSHDQLTSYFVGLSAIRHAQDSERARLGSSFSVARFNAGLLAMGSVEPRYIQALIPYNEPRETPGMTNPTAATATVSSATPSPAPAPHPQTPAPTASPVPTPSGPPTPTNLEP